MRCDKPDATYKAGETATWTIETADLDPADITLARVILKQNGQTVMKDFSLDLSSGKATIEAALSEPGTILASVTVRLKNRDGELKSSGGAAFDPQLLGPAVPEPADFDAFWQAKIEELQAVPMNAVLEPKESKNARVELSRIQLDNIRGTKVYGHFARPIASSTQPAQAKLKRPALLVVQWAGVYPLEPAWAVDRANEGWIVLNISVHDKPADRDEAFYKALNEGELKSYTSIGAEDRETSYFLRMYLACYRAVDYLASREDWDGKTLVVAGSSQGGQQAIVTAGLHPKVTAILANVPSGCDSNAMVAGRAPGFPGWQWKKGDTQKIMKTSQYFDAIYFASRVRVPTLIGMGLIDTVCPPTGIFAAYNSLKGRRELVMMPQAWHSSDKGSHQRYFDRLGAWRQALLTTGAPPAE